jgi:hypothetical protein
MIRFDDRSLDGTLVRIASLCVHGYQNGKSKRHGSISAFTRSVVCKPDQNQCEQFARLCDIFHCHGATFRGLLARRVQRTEGRLFAYNQKTAHGDVQLFTSA